jgi:threonylcarbamoyladenosine tRNA methylthiotransferase MtaB
MLGVILFLPGSTIHVNSYVYYRFLGSDKIAMTEKTFKIITLGCKVNQYESAYLTERLMEEGWRPSPKKDRADLSIVNTCIVTGKASYQSRQAIRKAIRENPTGTTAAVGCYAQVFPEELLRIRGVDIVAGNKEKARLPDILRKTGRSCETRFFPGDYDGLTTFDPIPIKQFTGRTRAFLKIQDGCESFCSYCIVPFARGPCRSLDPGRVIKTLESLCANGYKEVVFTGVHLGKYEVDSKGDAGLERLLQEIGKEGLPVRIRLSSLEPNEISRGLVDMIASEDWLCRHFHVPLQSGDREILKKMNRHYTPDDFAGLIERIHEKIPLAAIGVDVMAGFPGEDDPAHENTFRLISQLPVSYLHVFPYSSRKGTKAAGFPDQVPPEVIKERAERLRNLGAEKRKRFYTSCLGGEFNVLTEGWDPKEKHMITGISDNYLRVLFPSRRSLKNRFRKVLIREVREGHVRGECV